MKRRLLKQKSSSSRRQIQALILAPTKELAIQIANSFEEYGKNTNLRSKGKGYKDKKTF
ncbi:DEAD/DEAH box helicase [Acetoanaerobium pronyense]|uniref:DEAD/DEAH box helicase n=1 Tax=Acetoanaerobium pronyense TaxID=1482736 RepID=UPI001AE67D18